MSNVLHDYTQTVTLPSRQSSLPGVFDLLINDLKMATPDKGYYEQAVLLEEDFKARNEFGLKKYGVALKPFDLNDPLKESFQELLDFVVYFRAAIYERDHTTDPEVWQLVRDLVLTECCEEKEKVRARAILWLRKTSSSLLQETFLQGVA